MFSSIASYLFGSAPEEQVQDNESPSATEAAASQSSSASATSTSEPSPSASADPALKTRQADNEWILVEKTKPFVRPRLSSGSRPKKADPIMECSLGPLFKSSSEHTNNLGTKRGSNCSNGGDILDSSLCMSQGLGYHTDSIGFLGDLHDHHSDTAESDISSVPERVVHPSMEESWLVTPPACFTAGSKRMETSSMENLLIEHPSMSVYSHRGRPSSTGMDSDGSSSETDVLPQTTNTQRRDRQAGLARHEPPRRPNALAARVGIAQAEAVKSMQRSHQRHLYKDLSSNHMKRNNMAREVKSCGNRKLRSQRVQQPTKRRHNNKQY